MVVVQDDPVTGRQTLTGSAYADDRHIRSRLGVFAYAATTVDPAWRTSLAPWDGTQLVADIGCGAGFDLRQLVPTGRCRHAIGIDISAGMLASLADLQATGRLTLVQADAQHLPLADDAVEVALAMHMLYHVPDITAAIAELRRITKPAGTVLVSTNSTRSMSEILDLLDNVLGDHLGHPVRALPELRFSTETGAQALHAAFADVDLHEQVIPLAIPTAEPLLAYLASVRDPIQRTVCEPFDFAVVFDDLATRIEQVISRDGSFRAVSHTGVFTCH